MRGEGRDGERRRGEHKISSRCSWLFDVAVELKWKTFSMIFVVAAVLFSIVVDFCSFSCSQRR
jgi:hypothetical protein